MWDRSELRVAKRILARENLYPTLIWVGSGIKCVVIPKPSWQATRTKRPYYYHFYGQGNLPRRNEKSKRTARQIRKVRNILENILGLNRRKKRKVLGA
jgi:hypothetical protein